MRILGIILTLTLSSVVSYAGSEILNNQEPKTPSGDKILEPNANRLLSRKIKHNRLTVNLLIFRNTSHDVVVLDQKDGPGSQWLDSRSAALSIGGIAAINASFFKPNGEPLGVVIVDGVTRGEHNKSSLGKGVFFTNESGAHILRSSQWESILDSSPKHAIQSGPMLIERSAPVRGLSTKRPRVRSFIATDNNDQWVIGTTSECTLAELAQCLKSIEIPDFKIETALNLDGGRSTDLWISPTVKGAPSPIRAFWNNPVRNFLVVTEK